MSFVSSPEYLTAQEPGYARPLVLTELGNEELGKSASRWGKAHLKAYRLKVLTSDEPFLAVLRHDHGELCPVCGDGDSSQELDMDSVASLLDGCPAGLCSKTQRELLQLRDGPLWSALARATRSEQEGIMRNRPVRNRRPVLREEYVDSGAAIQGSSSPIQHSSSEYEAELYEVDEDEHFMRGSKPEEVTVHLVTCLLQSVLNLCLVQRGNGENLETEVQPRIERKRAVAKVVAGAVTIRAEDDGGICKMSRFKDTWTMDHACMVLLEAKRKFQSIQFDDRSDTYKPIFSDDNLAQCLGEAIITWKENMELLRDGVFVMTAINTFQRFTYYQFGRHYAEYLDASDKVTQRRMVNDKDKDTSVYMDATQWFNVQSPEGRKAVLCHILAILRWHDCHEPPQTGASDLEDHYVEDTMDMSDDN